MRQRLLEGPTHVALTYALPSNADHNKNPINLKTSQNQSIIQVINCNFKNKTILIQTIYLILTVKFNLKKFLFVRLYLS
jgi:hypothetical protein